MRPQTPNRRPINQQPTTTTHNHPYKKPTTKKLYLRVDDPLDSAAVHAGNGILGIVLLGFMAQPEHVAALTGSPCGGLFYMKGGDSHLGWTQLGMQLMGECVSE